MSSRDNRVKGYPKKTVRRHFDGLTTQTELDDPNFAGESRHTVMLATLAMDDREFVEAPERESEPDGVIRRNRIELAVVCGGLVVISVMSGFILGSASAPANRPPVGVSVSPQTSVPPSPNFTPHPMPGP